MPVRVATPSDADAIAEVEGAAADVAWTRPDLEQRLAEPTTLALVVHDDDHLAGHVLATATVDEGEILTIAVHPDHRRRGHARALLVALAAAWSERGVRTGWLEVRADNDAALALYRSAGWTEAGRRPRYYPDDTDAIVLSLALWGRVRSGPGTTPAG